MRFNRKLFKEAYKQGYKAGKRRLNESDLQTKSYIQHIQKTMPNLAKKFSDEGIAKIIDLCDDELNDTAIRHLLGVYTEYNSRDEAMEEEGFDISGSDIDDFDSLSHTIELDNGHVLVYNRAYSLY